LPFEIARRIAAPKIVRQKTKNPLASWYLASGPLNPNSMIARLSDHTPTPRFANDNNKSTRGCHDPFWDRNVDAVGSQGLSAFGELVGLGKMAKLAKNKRIEISGSFDGWKFGRSLFSSSRAFVSKAFRE
jgi:hypothetical protein